MRSRRTAGYPVGRSLALAYLVVSLLLLGAVAALTGLRAHDQANNAQAFVAAETQRAALAARAELARVDEVAATIAGVLGQGDTPIAACDRLLNLGRERLAERVTGLAVADPGGRVMCATHPALRGTTHADMVALDLAQASPSGGMSWIMAGEVTGQRLIVVAHAIRTNAAFNGVVVAAARLDHLRAAIGPDGGPGTTPIWLVDTRGAREQVRGAPGEPPPTLDAAGESTAPADRRRFAAATAAGALTALGELPAGTPARRALMAAGEAVLLPAAILILGGVILALLIQRGVRLPLDRLRLALERRVTTPDVMDAALAQAPDEIRDLGQSLFGRQEELRQGMNLRDLLLREVNHRVRNNLQMVASIIRLQGRRVTDPDAQAALRAAEERVHALAVVHNLLTEVRRGGTVDLSALLWRLAETQVSSSRDTADRIDLDCAGEAVPIDPDSALAVGLIVNEWLMRAVHERFQPPRTGRIRLRVGRRADTAEVSYEDDGPPPMPGDPTAPGRALMRALVSQLGAELEETTRGQLRRRLSLPADIPAMPAPR